MAVAFVNILTNEMVLVHTGLAFQIPKGYEMTVRQRSGMSLEYHNYIVISIGTIDQDYRGEIMIPIVNRSEKTLKIKIGDRIAQGIISPISQVTFSESKKLDDTKRSSGGFGHTGGIDIDAESTTFNIKKEVV